MIRTSSARSRRPGVDDLTWISLLSTAGVGVYLVVMHTLEPAGWARAHLHTRFVLSIGYGHLLSSVLFGRAARSPASGLLTFAWGTGLLLAYAIYTHACQTWPGLPLALLGVSAWHTFENDRAMRRTRLRRRGGLEPISRVPRDHLLDGLGMVLAGLALMALPRLVPWIHATDVIVAFTLQHLLAWLVFSVARGHAHRQLRSTLTRLAGLHGPMILACVIASEVLSDVSGWPSLVGESARLVLEPSTYLFWSAAHVAHTAWRRSAGAMR